LAFDERVIEHLFRDDPGLRQSLVDLATEERQGKSRVTISLDTDVLREFRAHAEAAGVDYQALINRLLRQHVGQTVDVGQDF
jgi:predicted DNA binding CopG/RHH family protein